jgi:hypothetical protein
MDTIYTSLGLFFEKRTLYKSEAQHGMLFIIIIFYYFSNIIRHFTTLITFSNDL